MKAIILLQRCKKNHFRNRIVKHDKKCITVYAENYNNRPLVKAVYLLFLFTWWSVKQKLFSSWMTDNTAQRKCHWSLVHFYFVNFITGNTNSRKSPKKTGMHNVVIYSDLSINKQKYNMMNISFVKLNMHIFSCCNALLYHANCKWLLEGIAYTPQMF